MRTSEAVQGFFIAIATATHEDHLDLSCLQYCYSNLGKRTFLLLSMIICGVWDIPLLRWRQLCCLLASCPACLLAGQSEKQSKPWGGTSPVQQQWKHWCVISTSDTYIPKPQHHRDCYEGNEFCAPQTQCRSTEQSLQVRFLTSSEFSHPDLLPNLSLFAS